MTNHSNLLLDQNELDIISEFENVLEKIFSTETKVVVCHTEDDFVRLAIELESNFSLSEIISLLKMPFSGKYRNANLTKTMLLFQNAVFNLNRSMMNTSNIEEISIYFKKTSITIHSIGRNSIVEELEFIVRAILHHYKYFSVIMDQVPNEIHIPVIEDLTTEKLLNKTDTSKPISFQSPYSKYWALYFDFIKKPLIYNLERTNISPGDMDLYFE